MRRGLLIVLAAAVVSRMGFSQPRPRTRQLDVDLEGAEGLYQYTDRPACSPPSRYSVRYGGLEARAVYRHPGGPQFAAGAAVGTRRTEHWTDDGVQIDEPLTGGAVVEAGWVWPYVSLRGGLSVLGGLSDWPVYPAVTFRAGYSPVWVEVGLLDRPLVDRGVARFSLHLGRNDLGSVGVGASVIAPNRSTNPRLILIAQLEGEIRTVPWLRSGFSIGMSPDDRGGYDLHARILLGVRLDLGDGGAR